MDKFKTFLEKITKSPLSILLGIVSTLLIAGTVTLVCLGFSTQFWIFILYLLSAFALTYLVILCVDIIPKIRQAIIASMRRHKFTNDLLESFGYRTLVFASISFFINVAYAIFQAVMAILARSVWLGALAGYYIIISLIRGGLVFASRRANKDTENTPTGAKAYRNCGIALLLLNLALVVAIVQMVQSSSGFAYAGLMIYVVATYTFYKLGVSIYNLFKAKKHGRGHVQAIKNLSFADALVSLLSLQTALISAFGDGFDPTLANSLTGGLVSMTIIALGIYMIIIGQTKLNKTKENINEGQI